MGDLTGEVNGIGRRTHPAVPKPPSQPPPQLPPNLPGTPPTNPSPQPIEPRK
jgi:hypothetical protein